MYCIIHVERLIVGWTHATTQVFSATFGSIFNERFTGPHVVKFLQRLVPTDLESLSTNRSSLSVLLNDKGGIIDDLMITKHFSERFLCRHECRSKGTRFKTFQGTIFRATMILFNTIFWMTMV